MMQKKQYKTNGYALFAKRCFWVNLCGNSVAFFFVVGCSSGDVAQDAVDGNSRVEDAVETTSTDPKPSGFSMEEDWFTVVEGSTETLDVLANDNPVDLASLEIAEFPRHGLLSIGADQSILFEAAADYNGYDSFRYRIVLESGVSHEATAHLTIYKTLEDGAPMVQLPRKSILADEVAVVINSQDPISMEIGPAYALLRQIPESNLIYIDLDPAETTISSAAFAAAYADVEAGLTPEIQAFVLTWLAPYRVECMSMTSAFALGGFSPEYCNTSDEPCSFTKEVDYFHSESTRPFDDHAIRPAMMLAGQTLEYVQQLVDRGFAADHTFPTGTGYLVRTSDANRSVRWSDFRNTVKDWDHEGGLDLRFEDRSHPDDPDWISDASDVLFYFTGLIDVPFIDSNTYRPGAVADHLTSFGGSLLDSGDQMSALRWLEAGVTASYGTVVEPCNYQTKFPQIRVFVDQYFRGATVLEAYWKSVRWPGEGVFIGEPLARPFGRDVLSYEDGILNISTTGLSPARLYVVEAADHIDGPYEPVMDDIQVLVHKMYDIGVYPAQQRIYRLRAK